MTVGRCSGRCLAGIAAVCLAGGCATPSYVLFYDRYAGTCQVSAPPAASSQAAADEAFVEALNDAEDKLRECYTDSLRYGETHGKIRLQVQLRGDGRADPVTLLSDTSSFPPLACCVVAVVRALRFQGSARSSFEYPFSFRTLRSTTVDGMGIPLTRSSATRKGYVAELDESTVVIGGTYMYPVGSDGLHYHTDEED